MRSLVLPNYGHAFMVYAVPAPNLDCTHIEYAAMNNGRTCSQFDCARSQCEIDATGVDAGSTVATLRIAAGTPHVQREDSDYALGNLLLQHD